ncbi:MAG: AtpZ/AtpI family protein [Candidatus Omnitrophica bacterium]|nr:AtpZ/AtpI family protein [Candidatus Omnitrophota bacterium]
MTRRSDPSSWVRQAGLLTSIPAVLLVGPALGYYLGTALDARWTAAPWGMVGGIVLGATASVRVIMQLIRQSRDLNRHD